MANASYIKMKTFIKEEWFKIVLSAGVLVYSIGFLLQSVKIQQARSSEVTAVGGFENSKGATIVIWSDGKWSNATWPKEKFVER
jgi:hypothetical protein